MKRIPNDAIDRDYWTDDGRYDPTVHLTIDGLRAATHIGRRDDAAVFRDDDGEILLLAWNRDLRYVTLQTYVIDTECSDTPELIRTGSVYVVGDEASELFDYRYAVSESIDENEALADHMRQSYAAILSE